MTARICSDGHRPGDVLLSNFYNSLVREGIHYLVIDRHTSCTGSQTFALLELSRRPMTRKPFALSHYEVEDLFKRVETYDNISKGLWGTYRTLDAVLEVTEGRIARFISEK